MIRHASIPLLEQPQVKTQLKQTKETCFSGLSKKDMGILDRAFPYAAFELAYHMTQMKGETAIKIFNHLKNYAPQSNDCDHEEFIRSPKPNNRRDLQTGIWTDRAYVLKLPKNDDFIHEVKAGVRIRQAIVDIYLRLGRDIKKMLSEFDFLQYIVVPVWCGDCVASLKVSHATSLKDIVFADRQNITFAGLTFSIDDKILPRVNLFPWMIFDTAPERIRMFDNIVKIVQFLHTNRIAHNDLYCGNFLIQSDNYTRLYLIDFGKAKCGEKFSPTFDREKLIELKKEYLLGSTKIDASRVDDPETFLYTAEQLDKIKQYSL
jgi:hypothetical protein